MENYRLANVTKVLFLCLIPQVLNFGYERRSPYSPFLAAYNPNSFQPGFYPVPQYGSEIGQHVTGDGFSPRFFSPFDKIRTMRTKMIQEENKKLFEEECLEHLRGKIVGGECYEHIDMRKTFLEAQNICSLKGGHIFTPDFNDIFLLKTLQNGIPEFLEVENQEIWVGARAINGRVIDVNGNDVTDQQYFQLVFNPPYEEGDCFTLCYNELNGLTDGFSCNANREFICEYPVDVDELRKKKGINSQNFVFKHKIFKFRN